MPLSAVRLLVFDIVVYFMANLHRSAGGFWAFHLFNYVAFLTMQGFFRTFGMFCRNFDSAFRIGVFVMPNMYVSFSIHAAPQLISTVPQC